MARSKDRGSELGQAETSRPSRGPVFYEVIDTSEWEGLIGVFEGYQDEFGECCDDLPPNGRVCLFFPLSRGANERYGMVGVNDYPPTIMALLAQNSCLQDFAPDELEIADF